MKGRKHTSGQLSQVFVSHSITCHCVIPGNAKLTPNKLGGAFGDGPVMFSLCSTIAQAQ